MSLPSTLYHYCSTSTFQAIVENRSLRLSSLSLSNDTMEGKLVTHTIERLATRDSLAVDVVQSLLQTLSSFEQFFDGFGFCLSKEADLLSQWRGYADDGSGVAIGFSSSCLEDLSKRYSQSLTYFKLQEVKYENSDHEYEIEPIYKKLLPHIDNGALRNSSIASTLLTGGDFETYKSQQILNQASFKKLSNEMLALLLKLYLLKSRAFKEENEWRLLSYTNLWDENKNFYRATRNSLVPYREVSLENSTNSIFEVILGPKHLTPTPVIEKFLRDSGFPETKVRRSEASYR